MYVKPRFGCAVRSEKQSQQVRGEGGGIQIQYNTVITDL